MEEKNNNKIVLYIAISCIALILIGIGGYFLFNNKEKPMENNSNGKTEEKVSENSYITVLDNKKILKSDLDLTDNAKINNSKVSSTSGLVFLDIIEPDFQFETHYLLCFDREGNLAFDARNFSDSDNDNNRYKFNGKFEYNEEEKMLSFYTNIFLGENDEATGTAFDDRFLSELTIEEKNKLGEYSDTVRYDYKYENKEMTFVQKEEINKLKDNEYYRNELTA